MPKLTDEQIMTLDEAIVHCYEVAEKLCNDCGKEHLQLAKWLEELKESRLLINRLKAKYNRLLGAELEQYEKGYDAGYDDAYKTVKTEAYKEVAELLKSKAEQIGYDPVYGAQMYVSLDNIANISKEMVGE